MDQQLVQLRFDPKFLVKNVTMSFGTTPPLSAQAKPTAISADEKAATTVKTIPIVVDTSSELTVDASPGSTSTSKRLLHAKISATRHTDRTCSNECKSSQDQSSVDSANVNSSSSSKSTNSSAGCLAAHEQRMEEQSMAVVADLAEQLQQLDVSNHSAHEKTLNADIDNTISTSALPAATLVPIVATNVAAATVKELQPDMVENIMQYRSRSPILTAHHMLEAVRSYSIYSRLQCSLIIVVCCCLVVTVGHRARRVDFTGAAQRSTGRDVCAHQTTVAARLLSSTTSHATTTYATTANVRASSNRTRNVSCTANN